MKLDDLKLKRDKLLLMISSGWCGMLSWQINACLWLVGMDSLHE
jgi:hypothetical protein